MSKESASSSGIGFTGLLTIVFIVLKLTGYIDWSWWWVTAPLWGGVCLVLGIAIVGFLILTAIALAAAISKKRL